MSIARKSGFTLIELLVVMVISMILIGLVLAPVVQSFNLMRRARAMVDAQDAARNAMAAISRDLGQAMYVYDNAGVPVELPVPQGANNWTFVPMPYAKIDFVLPKVVMHCNNVEGTAQGEHPSGEPRDYPRGDEAWPSCPVCASDDVEARPKLPLEQDVTVVRYFLGLANNHLGPQTDGSVNVGWVSPWHGNVDTGTENQVVLYRVEFSPYDDNLFPQNMPVGDRLSDPQFFYRTDAATSGLSFADEWARKARVVGIGKYEDLVVGTYDSSDNVTGVEPTITFRTAAIDNDTFAGNLAGDPAHDMPDAPPPVYAAAYGFWTPENRVTLYRDDYQTAYSTGVDSGDLVIHKWVLSGGAWTQTVAFNITNHLATGSIPPDTEMAFLIDPNRGAANFALIPPRPGGGTSGPVSILDPYDINERFRQDHDSGRIARRHATLSTFDPSSSNFLQHARIVPGSERVVGPDMMTGSDPTRLVPYERAPLNLGYPGLNQYMIDYEIGEIYFSGVWDEDLPVTDPSASDRAKILVDYKVQFNRIDDVVRGDYATKSLINIHMGMRVFDPESGKAHPVDLNKSVKVRNELR